MVGSTTGDVMAARMNGKRSDGPVDHRAVAARLREAVGLTREDVRAVAHVATVRPLVDPGERLRRAALLSLLDPGDPALQGEFATAALAAGEPEVALQAASALIALDPRGFRGFELSARACMALGLVAEAREDADDARMRARDARDPDAFQRAGAILAELDA